MSTSNKRDRQLAREHRDRQLQHRASRQAKRRRDLVVAGVLSAVLVLAGIVGLSLWLGGDDETVTATTGQEATVTDAAVDPAAPTADEAAPADGICPAPTASAPETPQSFASEPPITIDDQAAYTATLATNCGPITIDLLAEQAPRTVNSFAFLAEQGYFADSPCHRLTTEQDGIFVLQCGDPTGSGSGGPGYTFGIENAPADGVYPAGTIAMARTADPNSNGSQFFIVYEDTMLPTEGGGYSIFGQVSEGLDLVERIAAEGVDPAAPPAPAQPVSIESVTVEKKA